MGLEVTRIYKNSHEDTLRVDTIYWTRTTSTLNIGTGLSTYARQLNTLNMVASIVVNRVVANIEVITNANTIDGSGPPYNYQFVRWTRSNGIINGDMSDLPVIGDTV